MGTDLVLGGSGWLASANRHLPKVDVGVLILLLHHRVRVHIIFGLVAELRQLLRCLGLAVLHLRL